MRKDEIRKVLRKYFTVQRLENADEIFYKNADVDVVYDGEEGIYVEYRGNDLAVVQYCSGDIVEKSDMFTKLAMILPEGTLGAADGDVSAFLMFGQTWGEATPSQLQQRAQYWPGNLFHTQVREELQDNAWRD